MRHRVGQRKLGRVTEHRIAMLRNQAEALLRHERIETTVPKAKELRPFVERIITLAKRGLASGDANGRSLHARRLVLRDIQDRTVVSKLLAYRVLTATSCMPNDDRRRKFSTAKQVNMSRSISATSVT